ncbi:hypothetical protein CERZMDRAFT_53363, partial [Cercospora zeae-maydis SCOH1-5]
YFTRNLVKQQVIRVIYILGPFNVADIFTKALDKGNFKRLAYIIGITRIYEGRLKKAKLLGPKEFKAYIGHIIASVGRYSFPALTK